MFLFHICLPYLCPMKVPRAIRAYHVCFSPSGEDTNGRLHHHGHTGWSLWGHQEAVLCAIPSTLTGELWKLTQPLEASMGKESLMLPGSNQNEPAAIGASFFLWSPGGFPMTKPGCVSFTLRREDIFFLGSYENDTLNKMKVLVCFWMFIVGYVHICLVAQESELTVMLIQVS